MSYLAESSDTQPDTPCRCPCGWRGPLSEAVREPMDVARCPWCRVIPVEKVGERRVEPEPER